MSLVTAKALREQRANLATQAQAIIDTATAEQRNLTTEENTTFDRYHDEMESLRGQYERIERQETINAEIAESRGRQAGGREQPGTPPAPNGARPPSEHRVATQGDAMRSEAIRAWLMRGSNKTPSEQLQDAARRSGVDLGNRLFEFELSPRPLRSLDRESVRDWEEWNRQNRAQSTSTTAGGYTVPDDTMRALEEAMLAYGGMRQVADVIRTDSGAPLPWPTVNDTGNTGEIIGENTTVNQQDVTFGQKVLGAFKYSSKMILVSVELLQDASVNVGEFLGRALGTRIGRITNTHFTTGAGTTLPFGVVTGASSGKTGLAGQTTSVIYADLVDLLHSVDPEYRINARWMFADSTLKALKKLVDGQSRPLWSAGLAVREPDTILGYPYTINQSVAAMAANAKSILFGDFSKYKIRDVRGVTLLRLDERFADYHQVAFLAFSRHDGVLLDAGVAPIKYYANSAT